MQDSTGPPLQDQHGGALTVEVAKSVSKGRSPIPVHAIVNGYVMWVDDRISYGSPDMIPAWI